ncbi:MAG: 1-acyl-sn-glycerol-3-phosphate acyltransferase [Proteobacteria bacterium]|nr:1-acyl-sn-glycerol-3-phosphate acyltransferase [Pseudomonadota bacterium]
MTQGEVFRIQFQHYVGRFSIFLTAPLLAMLFKLMGYRIKNIEDVRKKIGNVFQEHPGPWIICANHLTMVDSFILSYGMFPIYRFILQYNLVPWNVPEKLNFNRNILLTLLCYLLKCIPVIRGGNRESIRSFFSKCSYVLEKGENLMIFPEGTRSRTGRIAPDNVSYGVGRLVSCNPDCRILCLYLRGDRQNSYSNIPQFQECFSMFVDTVDIEIKSKGLKAQRDYAQQIIGKLAAMEKSYFETCRQ